MPILLYTLLAKQSLLHILRATNIEQYAQILTDMESVGVQHGDIYKSCVTLAGTNKKRAEKCETEEGQREKNSAYNEWYELTIEETPNDHPHPPRLGLLDYGWAKLHGSYSCGLRVGDKAPKHYSFNDDRAVLDDLDRTFRRHLLVEQHFMVDWTQFYTEKQIRKMIKQFPNLVIRKMVTHPVVPEHDERMRIFKKFYNIKPTVDLRGKTPFNMYHIYDMDPNYGLRPSSKGDRLVNTAMFDFKKGEFPEWSSLSLS